MANRFPSGKDDYQRNIHTFQTKPSSSSRPSTLQVPERSFPRSAQPTARTTTTYYSSSGDQPTRQSYRARDLPTFYSSRSSNSTQHNQRDTDTYSRSPSWDSPLSHPTSGRGVHISSTGRQWTSRHFERRDDLTQSTSSYSHCPEYTPSANRSTRSDPSYSRSSQVVPSKPNNQYSTYNLSSPYRGRSSPPPYEGTSNSKATSTSHQRIQRGRSSYSPRNPKKSNKAHSRVENSSPPNISSESREIKTILNKADHLKEQCSICLNEVTNKASLKCNHSFCYECLVKWCAAKETCPLCRTKITELKELNKGLPNKRMYGLFRCNCGNRWKSSYTYTGIRQGCRVCRQEVEAHKLCPRRETSAQTPNFLGLFSIIPEKNSTHKQELCGMCKMLGKDCSRRETSLDEEDILDIVALENLMALFNLSDTAHDPELDDDLHSIPFSDNEDWSLEGINPLDIFDPFDYEYEYDYHYDYDYDDDCLLDDIL